MAKRPAHARGHKMWIKYTSRGPLDLRVLLRAARELVQGSRTKKLPADPLLGKRGWKGGLGGQRLFGLA